MIILARDKYFFNHRLKSSYIDFQIQDDSKLFNDSDKLDVKVKFLNASSSELIFDTIAEYNKAKGVFETVFQYGLRNFTLYNTLYKGMDGDYQQVVDENKNTYYKHQDRGVDNQLKATYYIFKYFDKENKTNNWYVVDYNYYQDNTFKGSIFQSDEYIFGDSPIPPFQFKSSTENRENKPYIVWNDNEEFPEQVDMTISFQYNEKKYEYTEKLSFTIEFISSDDKNNPDYFGKEIYFFQQNLTIPMELQKHIVVSLKKNEDLSSSVIDGVEIDLNKQYLEIGTENLDVIKEIQDVDVRDHLFHDYIIEFNRNGGESSLVTYKLFEASKSGKKNLTFSGLASENIVNSSDEEELQGNLGLSFNYFNDVDYKIQYNPQLMCWQIVSLLSGSELLSSGKTIEEDDEFTFNNGAAELSFDQSELLEFDDNISFDVPLETIEKNIIESDVNKGDLWNPAWTVVIPTQDENESSSSQIEEESSSSVVSSSSDQPWIVPEEYQRIENNNLAFKALSDSTIEFCRVGKPSGEFHIYYAVDQTEINQEEKKWVQYVTDENNKTISLTTGQIVQFKNDYTEKKLSQDDENYYYFKTTGNLSISGNINSMSNFSTLYDNYIFYRLFYGCTISDASDAFIIIENLSPHCFDSMFEDCTDLQKPIKVFSKNLAVSCFEKMYKGCTSLIESPELSYKYLINRCYAYMFSGCTSLEEAPELPATTLAPSCYEGMFSSVYDEDNKLSILSGIVNPPELPATILANSCYESMFKGCENLTTAPSLPATSFILNKHELNESTIDFCYASMFEGCISLTNPPELIVQNELSLGCYHKMFAYSGITEAPTLKSTILPNSTIYKEGCYSSMFEGCTGLTITPILNTPNLTPYCYHSMFKECENLVEIDNIQAVKLSAYSLSHMFENCISLTNEIWNETEQKHVSSITDFKFQQLSLHSCSYMFAGCSSLTKALLFSPTVMFTSCYQGLYKDCTKLTKIVYLPAKEIAYGCYAHMFEGCTSLEYLSNISSLTENIQEKYILPASKLFANCYSSMFEGCTQLKQSPSLSTIRNLASNCCQRMFYNCTSLIDIPELPATVLAESCYESMFEECSSIEQMPQLPATILSPSCYKRMFYGCISLLNSTRLYANELVEQCYMKMFENCTKLNYLDFLFKSWNDTVRATEDWVKNVASIGACRYYFSYFNDENGKPEVGDSRIPKYWYLLDYLSDKPLRITATDNVLGVKINKNILEGGDSSKLIDYIYYNKNNSFVKKYDLNKSQTIILQPDSFVEFWSDNEEFSVSDVEYFQVKVEKIKIHENPLTFTAVENNSRLTFNYNSFYNHDKIGEFYYKLSDYEEWIRYEMGEIITLINQGDSVKFMNINPNLETLSYNEYEYMYFNSTNGKFKISGNINSLINEHLLNINNYSSSSDNEMLYELNVQDYGFYKLFYNMSSILDATDLIINANIVGEHAYEKMFYGCTGLKSIGDIVSISNNYHSYYEMFNNCISLRNVGDIISSIAGENAYERMFVKNYLKTVGNITTENAGVQSYYHMFYNAISITSSFDTEINYGLTVGNINATSEVSSQAYYRMFYNYNALNKVGDIYIPTTTSEQVCQHMFESCKNLGTVGSLMHGTVPSKTFLRMFKQCYNLKTIGNIECYGETLEQGTYLDIGFSNNTSLTSVGLIKAIKLSNNVYENMFFGCTSLKQVGSISSASLANYCYESMFEGCSSLEEIDLINMGEFNNDVVYSCQDMFKNCSSLSTIKVGFNEWHENVTENWVNGVSNTGTFQVPEGFQNNNSIIYGQSYIPINWTVVERSNIEEEIE